MRVREARHLERQQHPRAARPPDRFLKTRAPDVCCLQETKVEDNGFPVLELRALGYDVAFHGQRTYNGVAILSRTPLADVTRGFDDGDDDAQARLIAATVDGVRIASVYVPKRRGRRLRQVRLQAPLDGAAARVDRDAHRGRPAGIVVRRLQRGAGPDGRSRPDRMEDHVLFSEPERAALARIVEVGLVDLIRTMHPTEPMWTWWDYRMLAFRRARVSASTTCSPRRRSRHARSRRASTASRGR
jgi:exodeoxyribonuclease-3